MVQRARLSTVHRGLLRRSDLRRQQRESVLEDDRLPGASCDPHARHGGVPRQTLPAGQRSEGNSRFQLRTSAMVTRLKNRTVVVCGGGFTAGLIARQLTAKNIDVLVLERGYDRTRGPRLSCRTSATSCDGTCEPGSHKTGQSKPIRCGTPAMKTPFRSAAWKRFSPAKAWVALPITGMARPGAGPSMIRSCGRGSNRGTASVQSPQN